MYMSAFKPTSVNHWVQSKRHRLWFSTKTVKTAWFSSSNWIWLYPLLTILNRKQTLHLKLWVRKSFFLNKNSENALNHWQQGLIHTHNVQQFQCHVKKRRFSLNLCSHIFLVPRDHGVYMYVVYIWKWSSAHALRGVSGVASFITTDEQLQ